MLGNYVQQGILRKSRIPLLGDIKMIQWMGKKGVWKNAKKGVYILESPRVEIFSESKVSASNYLR